MNSHFKLVKEYEIYSIQIINNWPVIKFINTLSLIFNFA
jgi:hypothetical protein